MTDGVGGVTDGVGGVTDGVGGVVDGATGAVGGVTDGVGGVVDGATGAVDGATGGRRRCGGACDGAGGVVDGATGAVGGVTDGVGGVTDGVGGVTDGAAACDGVGGVTDGVGGAVDGVGGAADGVTGGVDSLLNGGSLLDANVNIHANANLAAPIDGAVAANANVAAPIDAVRRGEHRLRRRGRASRWPTRRSTSTSTWTTSRRTPPPSRTPASTSSRHAAGRGDRMSATVDRPAAPAAPEAPRALARAEGLELLGEVSGSGYKEGAALVRRADGQMVQLGPLMYGLLEEIDGERDHDALAAAMSERLGRRLEAEHVDRDRREARRAGPARRLRGQRAAAPEPAAGAALEGPLHRPEGDAAHHARRSSRSSARGS